MDALQTPLGTPGTSSGASTPGAGTPGASSPANGAPANVPGKSTPGKSTPEQRAKWRAKRERAKLRKAGGTVSGTDASDGADTPAAESVADSNAPLAGASAHVPWTADILRPMFEQCVPAAEKLAKLQLIEEAKNVSPAAVKLVESKGGWDPISVAALKEGGAQTAAKHLNRSGISAEYAPEVQLGIALGAILFSHVRLLSELREMAAEKKANKAAIDVPAKVEAVLKETAESPIGDALKV